MAEADHLFMRPMPNLMPGEAAGAALFTYIVPEQYGDLVRKFVGPISNDELKKIPQIGNSPTILSVKVCQPLSSTLIAEEYIDQINLRPPLNFQDFHLVAPVWYNITMGIFDDDEAHKAWSWVLEMYGYSLATYKVWDGKNNPPHPPSHVI